MLDFSRIPLPDVIEVLDFEGILAELCADFRARFPDFDALVESDPAIKLMEAFAYRETLLRARINAAARACMLATATGADLDNVAANFGVARKDGESDADLRSRVLLTFEAMSTAGSRNAYTYHTMAVDGVRHCSITSPTPGVVHVHVLAYDDAEAPYAALLPAVAAALNKETVRPLTDTVEVYRARAKAYAVRAAITISGALEFDGVRASAEQALADYVDSKTRLGEDVPLSGIMAALSVPGVVSVAVAEPAGGVFCDAAEYPKCTGTEVSAALADDVDKMCTH